MAIILVADGLRDHIDWERPSLPQNDLTVIIVAYSAEEVLKIHREERADLIVIDFDIPGMPGDELCRIIREDEELRDVSLMVACPAAEEVLSRCLSCGANSVFTRPISREQFVAKARDLLKVSRRKELRLLLNIGVEGQGDVYYSKSENISTSGMFLWSSKPMRQGDNLSLSFYISLNRIRATGEVVRVEQKGRSFFCCGIRFLNLEPGSRELIETFIRIRDAAGKG